MNHPTDEQGRYIRIPIPLKRESTHAKVNKSLNLIEMHKRSIEREKKKLGVSDYGLLWISFLRGVVLTLILERLIFH